MTNKIVVFYGSKKDFEELISKKISEDQVTIPFMELIQHYNARLLQRIVLPGGDLGALFDLGYCVDTGLQVE